ncbi:single-stranded DNA-binding protein [Mycobacteroides abscessus]|uniref:single-stranded DNA-binding protein n=1 Tax=Mycobacteroides abscessus TaxID=36809 RepID=UPI00092AD36E|nr:single-stranded DNA-binding protein [Mycobacteroides abscessus]SIC19301.1 single-stranded DNA-binding protein [Mycobacteroides abscessus subsp. abscessus]
MSTNTITISGNIGADIEPSFTRGGTTVVNFTVADTPRFKDDKTGEWRDGETLWQRVAAFGVLAENIAQSFKKGDRVVVTGRLTQKSYLDNAGDKRVYTEVRAEDVGPSLKRATVVITRNPKKSNETDGQDDYPPYDEGQ